MQSANGSSVRLRPSCKDRIGTKGVSRRLSDFSAQLCVNQDIDNAPPRLKKMLAVEGFSPRVDSKLGLEQPGFQHFTESTDER
jgi:hypothetical protein